MNLEDVNINVEVAPSYLEGQDLFGKSFFSSAIVHYQDIFLGRVFFHPSTIKTLVFLPEFKFTPRSKRASSCSDALWEKMSTINFD